MPSSGSSKKSDMGANRTGQQASQDAEMQSSFSSIEVSDGQNSPPHIGVDEMDHRRTLREPSTSTWADGQSGHCFRRGEDHPYTDNGSSSAAGQTQTAYPQYGEHSGHLGSSSASWQNMPLSSQQQQQQQPSSTQQRGSSEQSPSSGSKQKNKSASDGRK